MAHRDTPQARCRAGFARAEITPPVGIYHRLWGAARHERSAGVHRPLLATAMWMAPTAPGESKLIISLDQCLLDRVDVMAIKERISQDSSLRVDQVHIACSHTHASGWMSRSRAAFPGGELIEPYLKRLAHVCADLASSAQRNAQSATMVFGSARCALAAHRDYLDPESQSYVCGFNPAGPADDTVVLCQVTSDDGTVLGTLVNYACHPTTLAWENMLLSPDFVGAMRETIEQRTGAACLFLQGASGDLGPRDGFVGDPAVADRNGRQLGFAALSGLESLPPPGTTFRYAGSVVSGATLGIWAHEAAEPSTAWNWRTVIVNLPYRANLPSVDKTRADLARWQREEEAARAIDDLERSRVCRAHVERMNRQLARLGALPAGPTYPFAVTVGRTGSVLWVLTPGEQYQVFQTALRDRYPGEAIVVATLVDDWQPGYMPTAASYGLGIYQETIAVLEQGSLETLIDAVSDLLGTI